MAYLREDFGGKDFSVIPAAVHPLATPRSSWDT
jgi:hypothetical protein